MTSPEIHNKLNFLQKRVNNYERLAENSKDFSIQSDLLFARMDLQNYQNKQKSKDILQQFKKPSLCEELYQKYYPNSL